MTSDPQNPQGTGAILRALGSLMAALGSDAGRAPAASDQQYEYVYEPQREALRNPPATSPATPRRPLAPTGPAASTAVSGGRSAEVESLLSDARQRAERILQESMERANELISRDRQLTTGSSSTAEVDALRRSVDDLVLAMRDVQSRVGRIESILGDGRSTSPTPPAPPAAAAPTTPPPPARPTYAPPAEEERRPGVLSVVSPQSPAPAPPRPTAPPPSILPPSAVPPIRGGSQPAAAHAPAPVREEPAVERPAPERAAPERIVPQAEPAIADWQRGDTDDVAGTLATFTPADGSVQLRAAPVSGFQGLMRLQDALQRIPAVRQATVEAYSQGEARLRLELAADVDSDEIADGLGAGLGQSAVVQEASEDERTITIAFG